MPGAPLARVLGLPAGRLLVVGLAVGGEVAVFGITAAGRRSGGDLNPAVTLALWMRAHRSRRDLPAYWLAQLGGGCAGAGVARLTGAAW
jgi:glycerol uptake facilitator protein/aquaporin Z